MVGLPSAKVTHLPKEAPPTYQTKLNRDGSCGLVAGPWRVDARQPDDVTDRPRARLNAAGVNSHYI